MGVREYEQEKRERESERERGKVKRVAQKVIYEKMQMSNEKCSMKKTG